MGFNLPDIPISSRMIASACVCGFFVRLRFALAFAAERVRDSRVAG